MFGFLTRGGLLGSFGNLWHERRGVSAVEFAIVVPMLLMALVVALELGRAMQQSTAIEKGLRTGALFAARADTPLSAADETTVGNLAKYGNTGGTGDLLVAGWDTGTLTISEQSYTVTGASSASTVIRLEAEVPFDPLLPGLLDFLGFSTFSIELSHEQAYVGT